MTSPELLLYPMEEQTFSLPLILLLFYKLAMCFGGGGGGGGGGGCTLLSATVMSFIIVLLLGPSYYCAILYMRSNGDLDAEGIIQSLIYATSYRLLWLGKWLL